MIPRKPFPNYKWRWAVLTPTESLNKPPVFLGALRVFNAFNNFAPSSPQVNEALMVVETETEYGVTLARKNERNVIRNSGGYWKALGLLETTRGKIDVTPFGKMLAEGEITQIEFATTIIKTLELPNKRIETSKDIAVWEEKGLKIKPLQLILDVMSKLAMSISLSEAYITPFELSRIVIPLAGITSPIDDYVSNLMLFRKNLLDLSDWPDCVPEANDRRMAREFLLFLENYGFCYIQDSSLKNDTQRFYLENISVDEVLALSDMIKIGTDRLEETAILIRESHIPANIERKKVGKLVLERPYQSVFRKNVLAKYETKCLITGVQLDNVLEAAHIKGVKYAGSDYVENAFCLRSDIHQLFDSGHLKIKPTGDIILSDVARKDYNYGNLPSNILIPKFVNLDLVDWRFKYQ